MEIVKADQAEVYDLLRRLIDGQVLVVPTETTYGLVGDSTSEQVVRRICQIKKRDPNKPLPVICHSLEMVKRYFFLSAEEEELVVRYWPGPLAIVLLQQGEVKANLAGDKVAVRVTSNKFLQDVLASFNKPLVATSANLSGQPAAYSAQQIITDFTLADDKPDLVVAAGLIPEILPSTIIEVKDQEVRVLRQGPIKFSR